MGQGLEQRSCGGQGGADDGGGGDAHGSEAELDRVARGREFGGARAEAQPGCAKEQRGQDDGGGARGVGHRGRIAGASENPEFPVCAGWVAV